MYFTPLAVDLLESVIKIINHQPNDHKMFVFNDVCREAKTSKYFSACGLKIFLLSFRFSCHNNVENVFVCRTKKVKWWACWKLIGRDYVKIQPYWLVMLISPIFIFIFHFLILKAIFIWIIDWNSTNCNRLFEKKKKNYWKTIEKNDSWECIISTWNSRRWPMIILSFSGNKNWKFSNF